MRAKRILQVTIVIGIAALILLPIFLDYDPGEYREARALANAELIDAAKAGNTARVEQLLDRGSDAGVRASTSARDKRGLTALMIAAGEGHTETVKVLLASGGDVNAKSQYGWTALMGAASHGHIDTMKVLIAEGADVNAVSNKPHGRWTTLMSAALGGHTETVEVLVAAGGQVVAIDDGEWSLLVFYAERKGETENLRMLERLGARP